MAIKKTPAKSRSRTTKKSDTRSKSTPSPKKARTADTSQKITKSTKATVRRQKVAAGVLEGKTEQQIAAEIGVSREHVNRIKAQPETQLRIRELLAPHEGKLKQIISKALDRIETGMDAPLLNQIGGPLEVYEPPTEPGGKAQRRVMLDHKAVNAYITNGIRLLQAAEPKKDIPIVATVTLEQLEAMLGEEGLL